MKTKLVLMLGVVAVGGLVVGAAAAGGLAWWASGPSRKVKAR